MGTSAAIARITAAAAPLRRISPARIAKGSRDVQAFIVNSPEQKGRWLAYISAGLIIVGVIALAISSVLGLRSSDHLPGSTAPTAGERVQNSTEAETPNAVLHFDPKTKVRKMAHSLTGGAEAEAAIEQAAVVGSAAFPERQGKNPALAQLLQVDSSSRLKTAKAVAGGNAPGGAGQTEQAADSPMVQEVRDLLSVVKSACENEDKQALLAMLDQSDPLFHEQYVADAERLFRRFDDINVSFSGVEVSPLNQEEALVKVHVRVEGAFALTGSWMVLSNSDQSFTLRKHSESNWKLCAVN